MEQGIEPETTAHFENLFPRTACKERARKLWHSLTQSAKASSVTCDDAIPARVLGDVESPVGGLNQGFRRGLTGREEGRAPDADGHLDRAAVGGDREFFYLDTQ